MEPLQTVVASRYWDGAVGEEGGAEADGLSAGGGYGELIVPEWLVAAGGVADESVVRAEERSDAEEMWVPPPLGA